MYPRFYYFISLTLYISFCALLFAAGPAHAQYPGFGDPGSRSGGGTGEGLVPVTPTVDGGTIPIGASAQVVIRFRNDGSQPVQTGLIRLYPSSNVSAEVSLNQCKDEPLPGGAECAIALSVKALQAGSWRLEMLMSHSGRARLVTTTISGQVESTGESSDKLTSDIEAIPDTLDFGSLNSSQTLVEPVILRNITSVPLDITDMYIDTSEQAGYSLKADCKKLAPGQACIAIVTWSPQLKGKSSGVLVVHHSGPTALSSIPLSGEYSPEDVAQAEVFPKAVPGKGLLVSSQTEIDFGTGVNTTSTITVSLVNAGDMPLTLQGIHLSGSDNGLSFKDDGCASGMVLEPIQACPLTVTWSPTRVGALFDDIQILHNGARGVLVLPVRGGADAPVSQDQKAILLSGGNSLEIAAPPPPGGGEAGDAPPKSGSPSNLNPSGVLDGYKITSFSPTKAIINGPGGSRLVFDNEEAVLGGVPWLVSIQDNGIEFLREGHRILLLFDRSLSSINQVSASSSSASTAATAATN